MRFRVRQADPMAARELGRALGLAPALAQVLLHRGISDAASAREFVNPQLSGLSRPDAMLDRELAADRLVRAIRARETIAVFGDYDVDGTTSAVVLCGILEALGAEVCVFVGNRFDGGYGLSDAALARVLEARPSLLVTCDCGSSDHERIARARAAGVDVIVVDHHLVPDEPLPALAFLNPHRPGCGFEYKGLASAGLALSLGAAVRARLGSALDLRTFLDLVALGTIADVAPLDGDNRRLVRAGLVRLAEPTRPGVVALRELARIRGCAPLSAMDVAFRMTPRLNAPGRMGDADLTLALLRARDVGQARMLAARVEQRNDERKAIEKRVTEQAVAQVIERWGPTPRHGIVAFGDELHRGVVGISAARLVERFGVPAIVVGVEGATGHGSARAPSGFALHAAIARCAGLLERFGGHDAACGLTLTRSRLEAFAVAFAEATRCEQVASAVAEPTADVQLEPGVFELPGAADLAQLEPFGAGNREPIFALPRVRVVSRSVVAGSHLKLGLQLGRATLSAFGYDLAQVQVGVGSEVSLLGTLRADAWMGGDRVELRLLAVAAEGD
jgi:single-stranded-DNA-specific exonuclease